MEMELIEEQLANQIAKQDIIQDEILGVHKKCVYAQNFSSSLSVFLPLFPSFPLPFFSLLVSLFAPSLRALALTSDT